MRSSSSKDPIAVFRVPIMEPEQVEPARARFDAIALDWAAVKRTLREAREAEKQAAPNEARLAADAILAGKEPPQPSLEQEARAKVAELDRRFAALSVALDDAGDALAGVVGECRDEWLSTLERHAEEQTARFRALVDEALEAADELGRARGGIGWLSRYDAGKASVGQVTPYHAKPEPLPFRVQSGQAPPASAQELLQAASTAVEPPAPRPVDVAPGFERTAVHA